MIKLNERQKGLLQLTLISLKGYYKDELNNDEKKQAAKAKNVGELLASMNLSKQDVKMLASIFSKKSAIAAFDEDFDTISNQLMTEWREFVKC